MRACVCKSWTIKQTARKIPQTIRAWYTENFAKFNAQSDFRFYSYDSYERVKWDSRIYETKKININRIKHENTNRFHPRIVGLLLQMRNRRKRLECVKSTQEKNGNAMSREPSWYKEMVYGEKIGYCWLNRDRSWNKKEKRLVVEW